MKTRNTPATCRRCRRPGAIEAPPPAPQRPLGCFSGAEGEGCNLSPDEARIAARVRGEPPSWRAGRC